MAASGDPVFGNLIGSARRLSCEGQGWPAPAFSWAVGTYWLAGMVTTGADPLIPVSAIENSSITIPNVYFD
jgi:hypothetical protein